jgi:hypothetical protein
MTAPDMPPQWDYRIVVLGGDPRHLEPQLKQLGWEGWELVLISGSESGRTAGAFLGVFKRMVTPGTPMTPTAYG